MASLQLRGTSWRILFNYQHKQYSFPIGEVSEVEAHSWLGKVDLLLMRIKQRLLDAPPASRIVEFLQHDGRLPDSYRPPPKPETQFAEFRDSYLRTFSNGAIEENTLYTTKIHLAHCAATLGEKFIMNGLSLADLQRHIDRRQKDGVEGITIKKELDTLRSAWNWNCRMRHVEGDFPSGGLVYPKSEEKLPFMSWAEIKRRLAAGGDPDELWECLYLQLPEVRNRAKITCRNGLDRLQLPSA